MSNAVRNSTLSESPTVVGDHEEKHTDEAIQEGKEAGSKQSPSEKQENAQNEVARREAPDEADEADPFLVEFKEGDRENPQNWSRLRRWYITVAVSLLVFTATFSSSAPSEVIPQLQQAYGFSEEIGTLTISLFVAGYCVGPLIWGPLSEQYGRRPIAIISFGIYTCFQVGTALSKNTASILVFRFLAGTFAAAPLTNSGGVIADIWDAKTRGNAMAIFTISPFAGPALGPVVGGYIVVAGVSWRWVFWVMVILSGLCFLLIVFTIPETYAPTLLSRKARRIRKETADTRYYAKIEHENPKLTARLKVALSRPFLMLVREPMLLAITVYMSFVYGCIYLLFEAYPIVFNEGHGFNPGVSGLMFIPIPVGGAIAVTTYVLIFNRRYMRLVDKHMPNPVPPEVRLEIAMIAAPLFAISFFWFAWTSFPSVSFWSPLMAGGLMGFATCWVFISLFNYIIDAYLYAAASGLAANTVVRSLSGAGFPLFATQMYNTLNPEWASTLIGFIALVMIPIPFVLVKFGPALRRRSRYAPMKHEAPKQKNEQDAAV